MGSAAPGERPAPHCRSAAVEYLGRHYMIPPLYCISAAGVNRKILLYLRDN
jgi:hypothetical protein